jgi:DNA-binding NarL/FixJ family response regulator
MEAAMPIRVVVVDDDADFLWLIRLSLQLEHDITVIGEAEEAETGVALALREQPDIVVMDLMMPRIDGFEATKRIKRSRPAVKVLAVTSLSLDNAIRQEMYRSGADAFLGKRDVATALVPTIRSLAQS